MEFGIDFGMSEGFGIDFIDIKFLVKYFHCQITEIVDQDTRFKSRQELENCRLYEIQRVDLKSNQIHGL